MNSVLRTGTNTSRHTRDTQDMVPYTKALNTPAPVVSSQASAWKIGPEDQHHDPPQAWKRAAPERRIGDGPAVTRLTVADAALLQSFPAAYPWAGHTRASHFRQVGNAVPPLLAAAILRAVTNGDTPMTVVDLFAGPGGWEQGARLARFDTTGWTGVEMDADACATARAAGFGRVQADVAALEPGDFGPLDGLIASPPCQGFSRAGNGRGAQDVPRVVQCAHELAAGNDTRAEYQAGLADGRSLLVVEPLRWALALRPRWIACEQVPAVLPLWSLFAQLLASVGYSATAGVLKAEQYGVPQTRRRAILVARLDGDARLPEPTHQSYSKTRKTQPAIEAGLLPWVSMAQALGWDDDGAPCAMRTAPMAHAAVRSVTAPAATMTSAHDTHGRTWIHDRPATTIVGTRRSSEGMIVGRQLPSGDDRSVGGWSDVGGAPRKSGDGVRVTVQQAAVLQSFPAGYPWQGSRTSQYQQVGNAVPPVLAGQILSALASA